MVRVKRAEWQEKYCIADIDMEFIDAVRKEGGRISEVENPPLDYTEIKYERIKHFC